MDLIDNSLFVSLASAAFGAIFAVLVPYLSGKLFTKLKADVIYSNYTQMSKYSPKRIEKLDIIIKEQNSRIEKAKMLLVSSNRTQDQIYEALNLLAAHRIDFDRSPDYDWNRLSYMLQINVQNVSHMPMQNLFFRINGAAYYKIDHEIIHEVEGDDVKIDRLAQRQSIGVTIWLHDHSVFCNTSDVNKSLVIGYDGGLAKITHVTHARGIFSILARNDIARLAAYTIVAILLIFAVVGITFAIDTSNHQKILSEIPKI